MTEKEAIKIIEDYTGRMVISVSPIMNRGRVNQIFALETTKEKYILRTDLSENTTYRYQKEMWCAKVSHDQGVLTPTIHALGLDRGHPYMIMSHVEGKNGDESTEKEKDKIWYELGKYMQKIHSIQVEGYGERMTSPGIFKDSWLSFIEYNISSLNPADKVRRLGVITKKESEKIKAIFNELLNTKFNFGLNHYDLSLKNTILTSSGETHLIDWGSAIVAPVPHLDIAEILDSSLDEHSKQFGAFLQGYGFTFQQYEKIMDEIVKVNLLIHIDKLRWAIDRKKEKIANYSQEVREKLAKI